MSESTKGPDEKFCHECGGVIRAKAEICPKCGVRQPDMASGERPAHGEFKCLQCHYSGPMKTWLRNYNVPQALALLGLVFYVVPGLAFIAWAWGKRKCPKCGKLGEHVHG